MVKVKKAVIPAAGLGSRFYPLTKAQPKEMLPVLDKPVIHYVVEEAIKAGVDEILIIVGKGKDALINYFDTHELDKRNEKEFSKFPPIFFVRQREQLGLGDAIRYAKTFVGKEPFLVLLGDTIYKTDSDKTVVNQILEEFEKIGENVIAIEEVPREKIRDYGIISGKKISEKMWEINDLVEKPEPENAPSNLGITGIYVLQPDIFDYIDKTKPGKNGEYQLTDALKLMNKDKKLFGLKFEGKRHDIGTKELWVDTFVKFAKQDKRFKQTFEENKE
jgi:UTP--glucose-1-phosphate uridylyltransferase